MPHRTTLNRYFGFCDIGTGYNPDVIKYLKDECCKNIKNDFEREFVLIFDEMSIKSGIVYDKHSGKLVGYTELGNINNELDNFERNMNFENEKSLATNVLCLMTRGLFKHISYPIAYFTTCHISSSQLFPLMWEAVRVMKMAGFTIRAFICDGATPNRRFFELHCLPEGINVSPDGVTYWAINRYDRSKKIYFICDPPHLIKTLRNNFENSHGHNNTRNLYVSNVE